MNQDFKKLAGIGALSIRDFSSFISTTISTSGLLGLLFSCGSIQQFNSGMEGGAVTVCVDVGGDFYVAVAHEFLCYIDWDARRLQVCTERMTEAVGSEVVSYLVLQYLIPVYFRAHFDIHGPFAGFPEPVPGAVIHSVPLSGFKNRVKRLPLGLFESPEQIRVYGDIPNSRHGFGPFDSVRAAFQCGMDMDLIIGKIHIGPVESSSFPGAHSGIE